MNKNSYEYLPHTHFVKSLQSQIAYGQRRILGLEQEISYLKGARLAELDFCGMKSETWEQISDEMDTLKKTVKKLAKFQADNKKLLKYLVARQREIIDLHKSEENLVWE